MEVTCVAKTVSRTHCGLVVKLNTETNKTVKLIPYVPESLPNYTNDIDNANVQMLIAKY